jgi:hypothetical protein
MFQEIEGETYQATELNGGFPHLGWYRVAEPTKKKFRDGNGTLWELVARRTREFSFEWKEASVTIRGFENENLDGLVLLVSDIEMGYLALKAKLKGLGYPGCTALEIYVTWLASLENHALDHTIYL